MLSFRHSGESRNPVFPTTYETPAFINWATNVPPLLVMRVRLAYSSSRDLYMAGTINQTDKKIAPIMPMIRVVRAIAHATRL